jgi:phosphonopyruvate decarboxylase
MNSVLARIAPYASKRIARMARADKEFVSLSIGEPWFAPVPAAREILKQLPTDGIASASDLLSRYADGKGEDRLRELVSAHYQKRFGITINPHKNVLITHGGAQAFLLALLATTEAGDEVIVPDPTYMLYANTCSLLGRVAVRPAKSESDGFILSTESLKASITKRTRLLVLNSPENPTGVVYAKRELHDLFQMCVGNGVLVLQDEVYDSYVLDGEHWSCTVFDPSLAHSLQLNSMSKRYGLPGLRIGWLIANEQLIASAAKALEYISLSVSGLSHYVAERILADPELDQWIVEIREQIRLRRDSLRGALEVLGFAFPPRGGAGGFFLFPNVSAFADRLGGRNATGLGDAFADWLAKTAKIAVVPGSTYGSQGANHIRLVTTATLPALRTAITRFEDALS